VILTDGVHLISDKSLGELHAFAFDVGLKKCWFQGGKRRHPHYDLTTKRKVETAISWGAKLVTVEELVKASLARRKKDGLFSELETELVGDILEKG